MFRRQLPACLQILTLWLLYTQPVKGIRNPGKPTEPAGVEPGWLDKLLAARIYALRNTPSDTIGG